MNTRKKTMLMLAVGALLIVMAVGYAAASTMLSITGTANMEATWNVAITGIDEGIATGTAYNKSTPTYTGTTATFNVGLKNFGDSMTYNVTITNNGTLDAKVSGLSAYIPASYTEGVTDYDKSTKFSIITSGIKEGDIIKSGESKELQVYVDLPEYIDSIISEDQTYFPLHVLIGFKQNDKKETYASYDPNKRVMLTDGSIWRVLKYSSSDDDSVMIVKEEGLLDLNYANTLTEYNDYLNSTYKNTLSEDIKDNIVGEITLPKLANITSDSIYNLVCDRDAKVTDYITIPISENIFEKDSGIYSQVGTILYLIMVANDYSSSFDDRNILWLKNYDNEHNSIESDFQFHTEFVTYIDDISDLQVNNTTENSCEKIFNSEKIRHFGLHRNTSDSTFMIEKYNTYRTLSDKYYILHPTMTIKKTAIK